MATFILVKIEDEDFLTSDKTPCHQRWECMQDLGDRCMWNFIKDNAHRLAELSSATSILTCTTHPCMVLLLEERSSIFLKGSCWDATVPAQDGITNWICASMYSLAGSQFPMHRIPESSVWDAEMNAERKKQLQALELAFAMGTHARLGENSLVLNVFSSQDVARLLHNLCFRTRQEQVQREDVIKFIKCGF